MVIGRLCRASEGVKEKPLCWHLLLCQHLPSCSYSTSPIVRPSTKVSPPRHKDSRLVTARFSSPAELQMRTISHGSSQHENPFTKNHSHGSSSHSTCSTFILHMFNIKKIQRTSKEQEEQLSFDRGALVSIHVFIYS